MQPERQPSKPPALSSGIRDNRERGRVGEDFLREHLRDGTDLSIVSAYFTIHAYEHLKEQLGAVEGLRFLFGEPSLVGVVHGDQKAKAFQLTDQGLSLTNQLEQSRLARECAAWIREKVEIRSMQQGGFLHGKMYHLQNDGAAAALLGSANFTAAGLGYGRHDGNVELNLVVDSDRDRKDLLDWFDQWWKDDKRTEDVKEYVLQELKRLYDNHSPQFIYYLTLFHLFRDYAEDDDGQRDQMEGFKLPDTKIWRELYQFQKDGAKAAINKLLRLNGCILADSVGLGKTYTALAVIKYFELRNERVLVLCPKRLHDNWAVYLGNDKRNRLLDDRFGYDLLAHTDLSRKGGKSETGMDLANVNWGNYGLVVIDESHNFRNNKYAVEKGKQTRYQKLIEDIISSGVRTKALLLSATPVNNELSDLRNQISLIAGGDVSKPSSEADAAFADSQTSLGIPSVSETTRVAQLRFTNWTKATDTSERTTNKLLEAIGGDFFHLLDGLTIARSRSQIKRAYAEEMGTLGGFPDRAKPESIHSGIDSQGEYPPFEKIDGEIDELKLALYNPTNYLQKDLEKGIRASYDTTTHGGFTQEGRERILVCMMKTNFLKRLESSVHSFRETLQRTLVKTDELLGKLDGFQAHQEAAETDYSDISPDALDMDDEGMVVGTGRKFHLGHIDISKWREAIKEDKKHLKRLLKQAKKIIPERDAKLARLRERIQHKLRNPSTTKDGRENRKVLVFTAYADTANYLYKCLEPELKGAADVALVSGGGSNRSTLGTGRFEDILTNFSPRSRERGVLEDLPQDKEIEVLFATDCISEGQNLQDCDTVVNYDIHWNPVRIIQRFGRIDRIGSQSKVVHLVNFWPVEDLDHYLKLKRRVEERMALVDLSSTQSDNLLEDKQLEDLVTKDLQFRNSQLRRLKEEVLDLEDMDEGGVSIGDFSLEEFRSDLLQFLEADRQALESAPSGLYAVVQADPDIPAKPGAVFCLRRRVEEAVGEAPDESSNINPLGDHYLVYVHDDGEVRLAFTRPKQILNLLRSLAAGHEQALTQLCDLFDRSTEHGADLQSYNRMVEQALGSITRIYRKRDAGGLTSGRDGVLSLAASRPSKDGGGYELLTWFVIIDPEEVVA